MGRKALRMPPPSPFSTPGACVVLCLSKEVLPCSVSGEFPGGGHYPWDSPATSWGVSAPHGALTGASLTYLGGLLLPTPDSASLQRKTEVTHSCEGLGVLPCLAHPLTEPTKDAQDSHPIPGEEGSPALT